jgi:hypothetical protein
MLLPYIIWDHYATGAGLAFTYAAGIPVPTFFEFETGFAACSYGFASFPDTFTEAFNKWFASVVSDTIGKAAAVLGSVTEFSVASTSSSSFVAAGRSNNITTAVADGAHAYSPHKATANDSDGAHAYSPHKATANDRDRKPSRLNEAMLSRLTEMGANPGGGGREGNGFDLDFRVGKVNLKP